ncbi:MAG: hypothetical protein Q4C03_06990 [bacterium]|nr:hypothetical protein [bacterium]
MLIVTHEMKFAREIYNESTIDPLNTNNTLSLVLAQKAAESIAHQYRADQEMCNEVTAGIHD